MKYVFCLILSLAVASVAGALEVPSKAKVANRDSYCCWACLETLGRTHRIQALYDLVENRRSDPDDLVLGPWGWEVRPKNYGYDRSLKNKLDSLGVRYTMQFTGNYSRGLLQHADRDGCLVTVNPGAFAGMTNGHGIVLTHYDDRRVEFYDPNDPSSMYEATRRWFDYYWTGLVIVIPQQQR
jgi:hypothetical protein